jgi:hypothetical protein
LRRARESEEEEEGTSWNTDDAGKVEARGGTPSKAPSLEASISIRGRQTPPFPRGLFKFFNL